MKLVKIQLPKSFIDLTKGHVISQVIGAVCSILVAKLYGASALGVFSVFVTTFMIFSTINTFRLESVLFLDQNKEEKHNNTIGLLCLMFCFTIFLLVVFVFIPDDYIVKYLVNRQLLIFAILAAFLNSLKTIFQNLTLLNDDYSRVKYSKIAFTVIRYSIQIGLFFIATSYWGLVFGYLFAMLFVIVYFYKALHIEFVKFKYTEFKATVKKYRDLLKFALPGDIINTIAINIFPILLIANYGDKLTGNYFMSHLILSIPLTFLFSVISPVFFKKSVRLVYKDNFEELFLYTLLIVKRIFITISLPLLLLVFFGEEIVVFFLKEEWRNTGAFLEVFSLLFAFRVLYSPISSLEESLSKNHISLLVNIYFVLVLFGSVYLWKNTLSIFEIAMRISIMTSLGYGFLLLYFLTLLRKKAKLKTL